MGIFGRNYGPNYATGGVVDRSILLVGNHGRADIRGHEDFFIRRKKVRLLVAATTGRLSHATSNVTKARLTQTSEIRAVRRVFVKESKKISGQILMDKSIKSVAEGIPQRQRPDDWYAPYYHTRENNKVHRLLRKELGKMGVMRT